MDLLIFFQKGLISLFIAAISIILLFWCLPEEYVLREFLHRSCSKFICWVGLDNYWALFAPQPVSKNFLLGFEIEFIDGTSLPWKLPEYILYDGYQKTTHFRFIKIHNQLLSQKDEVPKEAICRYILSQYYQQHPSGKTPVYIHILRYYELQYSLLDIPWLSEKSYTYMINK